MPEIYKFNKNDYDENGFDKSKENLFLDFIKECEKDFHNRFSPLYANNLYGNYSSMRLLTNSFVGIPNEFCGMDGEYDLETNLKIEGTGKEKIGTIYAISRADDKDEPLFLTRDDRMTDGIIILKYIPDNDDEIFKPDIPINNKIKKSVLKN